MCDKIPFENVFKYQKKKKFWEDKLDFKEIYDFVNMSVISDTQHNLIPVMLSLFYCIVLSITKSD